MASLPCGSKLKDDKTAERLLAPYNHDGGKETVLFRKDNMYKEVPGRQWGKPYLAQPILDVIEKP